MAMRMMDDIIDLELEKVEQIIGKIADRPRGRGRAPAWKLELWKKILGMAQKGRRTGLGITAEGDMLAALGLRIRFRGGDRIRRRGAEDAGRRGLPGFGEDGRRSAVPSRSTTPAKEKDNPMIARIREADPELYAEMEKVGRRNIAMLTIAPTGVTTSLMSQTTSGIEPVFRHGLQAPPQDQPLRSRTRMVDYRG